MSNKDIKVEEPEKNSRPLNSTLVPLANSNDGLIQIRNILLGELVTRWENKINRMDQGVKELIKSTETRLATIEKKMADLDKELKDELETNLMDLEQENDDLRAMVEKFRAEFEEKLQQMDEAKLDKDSIADVFIQWGQSVRDHS